MKLYDFHDSGNGYKVRLLCAFLGLGYEYVEKDIITGETRTPDFLAKNPNGRIPLLELDDGTCLSESDAILFYLADGTPWWPGDKLHRTRVLQWMFFEQYNHEPSIAVARFIVRHTADDHPRRAELTALRAKGHDALRVMATQLAKTPWLTGDTPTIADVALYAYTHVAHQADIDVGEHPPVARWLRRMTDLDGFVPMTAS
ncbi:MAG: glutathione S-transferase family protein [Rhodospirillales bacterium]